MVFRKIILSSLLLAFGSLVKILPAAGAMDKLVIADGETKGGVHATKSDDTSVLPYEVFMALVGMNAGSCTSDDAKRVIKKHFLALKGEDLGSKDSPYFKEHVLKKVAENDCCFVLRLWAEETSWMTGEIIDGWTLLGRAVCSSRSFMFNLLMLLGPDAADLADALRHAAARGNFPLCKRLLTFDYDYKAADQSGWTALHHGAKSGSRDICDMLISAGFTPGAPDNKGQTPQHIAVIYGHKPVYDLVMKNSDIKEPLDHTDKRPMDYFIAWKEGSGGPGTLGTFNVPYSLD